MTVSIQVTSYSYTEGQLTMYTVTGDVLVLPGTDPRVPGLLEQLKASKIVDVVNKPLKQYDDFNKKSKFWKFVATTKAKLGNFLGLTPEERKEQIATIDLSPEEEIKGEVQMVAVSTEGAALPVNDELDKYVEAVVQGTQSLEGLELFMERLSVLHQTRPFSAATALKFMKAAQLPISKQGDLIAYKALQVEGSHFVDPHSRVVRQDVGTLVTMDMDGASMTSEECSDEGFHVASKRYLTNSYLEGKALFLIVVKPEDILLVPNETTKLRAAAYYLAHRFSRESAQQIYSGQAITVNEADIAALSQWVNDSSYEPSKTTKQNFRNRQIEYIDHKVELPVKAAEVEPVVTDIPNVPEVAEKEEVKIKPVKPKDLGAVDVTSVKGKARVAIKRWLSTGQEADLVAAKAAKRAAKVSLVSLGFSNAESNKYDKAVAKLNKPSK